MDDRVRGREKLVQFKIQAQTKPFIDKNLQIQIPGISLNDFSQEMEFHQSNAALKNLRQVAKNL